MNILSKTSQNKIINIKERIMKKTTKTASAKLSKKSSAKNCGGKCKKTSSAKDCN